MKLFMIRHGQSVANLEGLHAGWSQTPLTPKGMKDARLVGELLRGLDFEKVYCSDLLRARQTMELALPGVQAEFTPLLREIHVGTLSGKSAQACLQEYGEKYLQQKKARDFRPYGGENMEMQRQRIREFAIQVAWSGKGAAAAFCHEGSVRCMLDLALGSSSMRSNVACGNGSLSVFEWSDGRWRLLCWNIVRTFPPCIDIQGK